MSPRAVPRVMSTQHPDNVATPFFASGPLVGQEDEVREAYYAFSHLGCDEQMWDHEGKEVDQFVVEKLLSAYETFFAERPLGEAVFLTPRVPNPRLERAQAKLLLEVLHSLPRHSDAARMVHGRERVPIFELIYPMTTSAAELERVRLYYERFVAGAADVSILDGDEPLGALFGGFAPRRISVIPLIEERDALLAADAIVGEQLRATGAEEQRVFIARSDPALNYGYLAAVLLAMVALDRLARLERETGARIDPIIGVGAVPFRGGFHPGAVARCVRTYPSVQTFTAQSAFKYDHPANAVAAAVAEVKAIPRSAPVPVADDLRVLDLLDRVTQRYRREVATLAPLVAAVARHVPRRRRRRLHIGLFGYSRASGSLSLPRAIPFCAALYSVGLPPEVLGCAALTDEDIALLDGVAPSLRDEIREAMRYLDAGVLSLVGPEVAESVRAACERFDSADRDEEHRAVVARLRWRLADAEGQELSDLVVRGGARRGFLG